MHGENRGRTAKCSIDKINHRVVYNYSKIIPIRISIDRTNNLTECPIDFEVLQEFPMVVGGRDEKISLGVVRLNLSEYVEESETFPRRSMGARMSASLEHARDKVGQGLSHRRQSSSKSSGGPNVVVGISPTNTMAPPPPHPEENDIVDDEAEEGIVRRYLMQESKINSTLKIGILMVQIDGERNFVAPPLKTAPMFGGIAGIMTGSEPLQQAEPGSDDGSVPPHNPKSTSLSSKSRDASEQQDMYRRALAASWACQPGELPADECIEDIFAGGDGWSDSRKPGESKRKPAVGRQSIDSSHSIQSRNSNHSGSASGDEAAVGTLRPNDIRRMRQHMRTRSGGSDKSLHTAIGGNSNFNSTQPANSHQASHLRYRTKPHKGETVGLYDGSEGGGPRSRSGSLASLAPTLGSERGRDGFRRPKEVDEYEEREDLVAWKLPETVT